MQLGRFYSHSYLYTFLACKPFHDFTVVVYHLSSLKETIKQSILDGETAQIISTTSGFRSTQGIQGTSAYTPIIYRGHYKFPYISLYLKGWGYNLGVCNLFFLQKNQRGLTLLSLQRRITHSLNPMMGWCVVELDLARTKSVRYSPIIKCVAGSHLSN